ncbi:Hypothetical predicted protein [Mytilus galloprovincialis]|uniref:SOCS box domain-containing protein n=1 Tax=Mytilus galloprovincialis TaxID=29158 RepID=A0A8B6C047_MYTGA|nr:Hypothetical predicted protein [Mytilus galloprovincialis]
MGSNATKETDPVSPLTKIRLNRKEQLEWFDFIVDSSEDELYQHIKENSSIITAVMYFDSFNQCSCHNLEQCQLSKTSSNKLEILRKCILYGLCPHILMLRQGISEKDPLFYTDNLYDQLYSVEDISECERSNPNHCGIYWIHVAIMAERFKIVQSLLPVLSNYKTVSFIYLTLWNKFSPLHLAVVHKNLDLVKQLLQYYPDFVNNPCQFETRWDQENQRKVTKATHITQVAILHDFVEALECMWPHFNMTCCKTRKHIENSLRIAIEHKKTASTEYIMSKGVIMSSNDQKSLLLSAIKEMDIEVVRTCLLGKVSTISFVGGLKIAVNKGLLEFATILLDKMKASNVKISNVFGLQDCMIDAFFNHNEQIVRLLIEYKLDVNVTYCGLSLLTWSEILGLQNLQDILKSAGGMTFQTYDEPSKCILSDIVHMEANTLKNVKRLIERDFNVNGVRREFSWAYPPVYIALFERKFDVFEYLIFRGALMDMHNNTASQFNKKMFPVSNYYNEWLQFLTVLVKANVCLTFESYLNSYDVILEMGRAERLLETILIKSHTVSQPYRMILEKVQMHQILSQRSKDVIHDWFHGVKSLQVSCRNSLRKHYNREFYEFTEKIATRFPDKILKYLRCEDVLDRSF